MESSRQYPRTLHEAFPFGPSYGAAIERPAPNRYSKALLVAGVLAVLYATLFLAVS